MQEEPSAEGQFSGQGGRAGDEIVGAGEVAQAKGEKLNIGG